MAFEYFITNSSKNIKISMNVISGLKYFKTLEVLKYPIFENN